MPDDRIDRMLRLAEAAAVVATEAKAQAEMNSVLGGILLAEVCALRGDPEEALARISGILNAPRPLTGPGEDEVTVVKAQSAAVERVIGMAEARLAALRRRRTDQPTAGDQGPEADDETPPAAPPTSPPGPA